MSRPNEDALALVWASAERARERYVQGLISVEKLVTLMLNEEDVQSMDGNTSSQKIFSRVAQRTCSRILHDAWRSSDVERQNLAFMNLRRYLEELLLYSSYAHRLHTYAYVVEDVVHATLEILSTCVAQKNGNGPDDPAAFLKWTKTILLRQAYAFLERDMQHTCLSLDEQIELFAEQFIDTQNNDPLHSVLVRELQQTLIDSLHSLRNPHYRQVLLATYLMDIDEQEVARRMNVEVHDVYLWRHRGLKALRQHPKMLQLLQAL